MKKLLFIFNPKSGKSQIKNRLLGIVDIFVKAGYEVTVHPTQKPLDGKEVVIERGGDYDLIVCSGGDGTLNETVSGLMELQKMPLLGYIPTGTTNDFAASWKIPKDMYTAAENIMNGVPTFCDVGSFSERYFTYVAAFGLFTDIPYVTPQQAKNMLGHQAYLLEGVKHLSSIKPKQMIFKTADQVIEGDFIYGMVSNATSVGGFKNLCDQDVLLDDGLFEVMLVKMPKNPLDFSEIATALLLKNVDTDYIYKFKTDKLEIASEEVSWVLDGEFGGNRENVSIQNLKRAVQIIL